MYGLGLREKAEILVKDFCVISAAQHEGSPDIVC